MMSARLRSLMMMMVRRETKEEKLTHIVRREKTNEEKRERESQSLFLSFVPVRMKITPVAVETNSLVYSQVALRLRLLLAVQVDDKSLVRAASIGLIFHVVDRTRRKKGLKRMRTTPTSDPFFIFFP